MTAEVLSFATGMQRLRPSFVARQTQARLHNLRVQAPLNVVPEPDNEEEPNEPA